jgi:alginate O-acetyltransferase complex protein AlgJ
VAKQNSTRSSQAVAILFIAITVAGLSAAVISLSRWSPTGPLAGDETTLRGSGLAPFIDGSVSERTESELDAGMPIRTLAVNVTAAIKYLLFRAGNDGVVIGRGGWLYTREEFEHHPNDELVLQQRLEFILDVSNRFAQADVQLLVALVPSKARIVPGPLSRRWANLASHPRYDTALQQLTAGGVEVADLRPALESVPTPFLRTDTHWTPQGARQVAVILAETTAGLGLSGGVSRTVYETLEVETIDVTGDLMSFLPVGPAASALGLPPETVTRTETVVVSAPALGLFDTPTIPVTLVGTSYSADARWNFIGELQQALGLDVLNISAEAVGPFVPMADYLSGPTLSQVQPELVVWEIPERYLTLPGVELPGIEAPGP